MPYRPLTIDQLEVSPFNVRKDRRKLTPESIEWMMRSIVEHGLIMPLGVHPMKGRKGVWGVYAGQRRYLGFKKAIEEGLLPRDTLIDTMDRETESEAGLVALSTAENLNREDLYLYETYAALARSRRRGLSLEEIAGIVGHDTDWVAKGVRLGMLAEPIFKAYADETITLDVAKAFAATEDTQLQLLVFKDFSALPRHEQRARAVHELMKVGDSELTRLLLFVGEQTYRDAGGTYELDLFADEREHRGLVRQEGLLRELAAARIERIRAAVRTRAGRELRFAAEPPKNDFNMVDRTLLITPPEAALPAEDEARLAELKAEQDALVERSWQFRDEATGLALPGAEAAIAEIDRVFDPNEAEIEAIELRRPIMLPEGNIFATVEIDDTGAHEVRFWWSSHKARDATAEKLKPAAKAPARATPAPSSAPQANAPTDDGKPIPEGGALHRTSQGFDWGLRERADRRLKAGFGITADGVQSLRTIRRAMLRAQLLEDAHEGGTVARDYFHWGQLRLLLTQAKPEAIGQRRIVPLDIVDQREETTGADLLPQVTMGAFEDALETLAALPCFTLPDHREAFRAYCGMADGDKEDAVTMLACLVLERSLNADGYRVPLHDLIAEETGCAGNAELREDSAFVPTAPFFNLFGKDHRLELAIPFAGRDTVAAWAKRRTAEQNDLVAKLMLGHSEDLLQDVEHQAAAWVHPLLAFDLAPVSAPASAELEAAE